MKMNVLRLGLLWAMMAGVGSVWGQPWTYNFGTGTGAYNTASGNSTTFFSSTPSNGGTYRIRCATTGNQGSGFTLANPGTSLGTGTELQVNASVTASTNKFGVHDWTSPSAVGYLKFKYRTTSSGNGNLNVSVGINTLVSDNNGYTNQYNNSLVSFTIAYTSGSISSVVRRINGSNQTVTGSGFSKGTDQEVEVYCNNGGSSTTYAKGGVSYTLASATWDLWVDGTRTVTGAAKAGTLASGTDLSGFGFFAESSTSNAATIYIDDLEYSNSLPKLITSSQTGDWSNTSTWAGGIVPTTNDDVIVANGHTVTADIAVTRNESTTTTANLGGILATNQTFTNNGTTNINGTFQINQGGWATGNNFVYGSSGTLTFNNSSGSYGVNDDVFWPTSSGPVNVTVQGAGGITMNVARTVSGTFQTADRKSVV